MNYVLSNPNYPNYGCISLCLFCFLFDDLVHFCIFHSLLIVSSSLGLMLMTISLNLVDC